MSTPDFSAPLAPAASVSTAAENVGEPQLFRPVREPSAIVDPRITRWAIVVIAVVSGIVFSMMGTVVHQYLWKPWDGAAFPIGLIVALATITCALIGFRLITTTRTAAFIFALALLAMNFVLSQPSQGGSILVPASTAGLVWTFAPGLLALFIVGWPSLAAMKPRTVTNPS